jgi:hypothetical protein
VDRPGSLFIIRQVSWSCTSGRASIGFRSWAVSSLSLSNLRLVLPGEASAASKVDRWMDIPSPKESLSTPA